VSFPVVWGPVVSGPFGPFSGGHRAFQHRGLSWHRSRGEAEMGFFCHFPDGSIKKGMGWFFGENSRRFVSLHLCFVVFFCWWDFFKREMNWSSGRMKFFQSNEKRLWRSETEKLRSNDLSGMKVASELLVLLLSLLDSGFSSLRFQKRNRFEDLRKNR